MDLRYTELSSKSLGGLEKKGIRTDFQLLNTFPTEYRDYRRIYDFSQCPVNDGAWYAVQGDLNRVTVECSKTGKQYIKLSLSSVIMQSGRPACYFTARIWQGTYDASPYEALQGRRVVITGKPTYSETFGRSVESVQEVCAITDFLPRYQGIYRKMGGVSDEALARTRDRLLYMQGEVLEPDIITDGSLGSIIPYQKALMMIHHPSGPEDVSAGMGRIIFNDLLYFSLNLPDPMASENRTGQVLGGLETAKALIRSLPYRLTKGQLDAVNRMAVRAISGRRISVCIQGDVGCGKTSIAMVMMAMAAASGFQAVLMAPREKLAMQHYETAKAVFEPLGISTVLLTNSVKGKKALTDSIKKGQAQVIIGTQSLIGIRYKALAMVIIDEEQVFGVNDKEALMKKAAEGAHSIYMTATPIARTISNILYADRDVLLIKDKPKGRLPIITSISTSSRKSALHIQEEVKRGHKAFVIVPAITDNDDYGLRGIESTRKQYMQIWNDEGIRTACMHGRMKEEEAAKIMEDFRMGAYDVLFATTMIEVGIDIPQATVISIEQADRFGMSQLHQLRGRVGRSSMQSFCYLVTQDPGNQRLAFMCRSQDGFEIAEQDMAMRGPGDLLGTQQSGYNKFIDELAAYPAIFRKAREASVKCRALKLGKYLCSLYEEEKE